MTTIGKIIRDAWVFELIPETETCEGWNQGQVDILLDKVNVEWDKYGLMVSQLPEELRKRHRKIHDEAIAKAKAVGWTGEQETVDDK
jgi:riboflavin synthase alpha subunit